MRKIVVANWKQNFDLEATEKWLKEFDKEISASNVDGDVVIAPSTPYLDVVRDFAKGSKNVYVSSQNVSVSDDGAHTGAIGINQLEDFCDYCIVGHSELGEKRSVVIEKAKKCLEHNVVPILCFVDLDNVPDVPGAVLAWEDPKNISGGGDYKPKSTLEVTSGVTEIRSKVESGVEVIYGGSVNRDNASDLGRIDGLDGLLVGSASLDPSHFFEIIKRFSKK